MNHSKLWVDPLNDGNGNVTALFSERQVIVAKATYDPCGEFISLTGSKAMVNPYWFSSKQIHAASGKYDFLYRWFAPRLQRWLNKDPIAENAGLNLYEYIFNNPINAIDPLGLSWQSIAGNFAFGVLIGVGTAAAIAIAAPVIAAGAAAALVAAGVTATTAAAIGTASVTAALGIGAVVGTARVAGDIVGSVEGGNWDRVAFDIGTLGGGAAFGAAGGGRAIVGEVTFGRASQVPETWNPVRALQNDSEFGYHRNTDLSLLQDLWGLMQTGPTPLSAGGSVALQAAGVGTYVNGQCFVGETLVLTKDGFKLIEDIQVGEEIWAFDEGSGNKYLSVVQCKYVNNTHLIVRIRVEGAVIESTATHPFWIESVGWRSAQDLKPGDNLKCFDGHIGVVRSVERQMKERTVYNLEVQGFHTYFVSPLSIGVHNGCGK